MDFKIRMKRIMIHEIGIEADSFKHALHLCSLYCDQLDAFPLAAVRFEIKSVTRVGNDKGNNTKKQSGSTARKRRG
jgi:hypothetical protein